MHVTTRNDRDSDQMSFLSLLGAYVLRMLHMQRIEK